MSATVVVVCAANVCRSPLIAALLRDGLDRHDLGPAVRVESGGVDVVVGQPVCPATARLAADRGLRLDARPARGARAVDPGQIAAADLVVTADRRVRSAVLQQVPSAAARTFTLREAAELAQRAVGLVHGDGPVDRLVSFAAELNRSRGLVDLPSVEQRLSLNLPWRTIAVHAHDVPDAHDASRPSHRLVHRVAVGACRRLVWSMTECLDGGPRIGSGRGPW